MVLSDGQELWPKPSGKATGALLKSSSSSRQPGLLLLITRVLVLLKTAATAATGAARLSCPFTDLMVSLRSSLHAGRHTKTRFDAEEEQLILADVQLYHGVAVDFRCVSRCCEAGWNTRNALQQQAEQRRRRTDVICLRVVGDHSFSPCRHGKPFQARFASNRAKFFRSAKEAALAWCGDD